MKRNNNIIYDNTYVLFYRYALSHIDFHWGSINTNGSEHTIEGMSYPLEMQLVFYDSTFNNVNEVKMSSNADALVAISQMFKVSVATNFYPVFTWFKKFHPKQIRRFVITEKAPTRAFS